MLRERRFSDASAAPVKLTEISNTDDRDSTLEMPVLYLRFSRCVVVPKVCRAPIAQAPTAVAVEDPLTGIESDFYQTIIQNNLFAPLGTVLNAKVRPGSNLRLLATFTNIWHVPPRALIERTTTGQQSLVAVGEAFGDFRVTHVNAKNVRLQHNGEEVRLSLAPIFFLD